MDITDVHFLKPISGFPGRFLGESPSGSKQKFCSARVSKILSRAWGLHSVPGRANPKASIRGTKIDVRGPQS
ncbi:MAG: hypothetical protein ABS79_05945 [Planctomycetes bacterium SCN 63-9]|nr:MAG: hypothetical protein ABS79_05945 [Planctomycetes bacterium SCN 63-9]